MKTVKHHRRGHSCKGSGPTSFWLQEPELVFGHLALKPGMVFLDAGCGAGEYALHAAQLVGDTGGVIALDNAESSITRLAAIAREVGAVNITGHTCDITAHIPLQTDSVDVILLSTVLHIRSVQDRAGPMFAEFRRVLMLPRTQNDGFVDWLSDGHHRLRGVAHADDGLAYSSGARVTYSTTSRSTSLRFLLALRRRAAVAMRSMSRRLPTAAS